MAHLATRQLAVVTLLTLALGAAPRADADPTLLMADPSGLSGSETLLTFDDLGLGDGEDVSNVAGVEFMLSGGGPAKFLEDYFPREFGPQDPGSLNNYWGYGAPYPDLTIRFPAAMRRLSFELRANNMDNVAVTLLESGLVVDEVTVSSRGADQLYFYGFENPTGFDEVLLDVQANVSGAFALDNLTFEALETDDPPEGPSLFSCVGFSSPLEDLLADPRYAPYKRFFQLWLRLTPVNLLRGRLLDAEGLELGDTDLVAPPLAQVILIPEAGEDAVDVTAAVTWKSAFTFNSNGSWSLGLKRHAMRAPGTYVVTMESGDESEYLIDPTCSRSMIERALPVALRGHHGHGH